MKYLFDTHIILWALAGEEYISETVQEIIEDRNNEIYYSSISPWEIETKRLKQKEFLLTGEQVTFLCEQNGLVNIPVKTNHVVELKNILPIQDIKHNDPFDKMLLAQAITENMIFVTHDKKFEYYDNKNILIV